jgi:hypothetical protein
MSRGCGCAELLPLDTGPNAVHFSGCGWKCIASDRMLTSGDNKGGL